MDVVLNCIFNSIAKASEVQTDALIISDKRGGKKEKTRIKDKHRNCFESFFFCPERNFPRTNKVCYFKTLRGFLNFRKEWATVKNDL